jgi:hypothetical protein
VPRLGPSGFEIAAATSGAATVGAFVVRLAIPGRRSGDFRISDVPTATRTISPACRWRPLKSSFDRPFGPAAVADRGVGNFRTEGGELGRLG